jgi:hypothetical protein
MIKIETGLDWRDISAAVAAVREAAGWDGDNVHVSYSFGTSKLVFRVIRKVDEVPPKTEEDIPL